MGQAAIFGGNYVKTLKDKINLFDKAYIVTGTADPTSVATAGPKGSIYMRQSTPGAVYVKLDDGTTTNWNILQYGLDSNQDRNIKLIEGGIWSLSPPSSTVVDKAVVNSFGIDNLNSATSARAFEFVASESELNSISTSGLSWLTAGTANMVCEIWTRDGANNIPLALLYTSTNSITQADLDEWAGDVVNYPLVTFNFSGAVLTPAAHYFMVLRYSSYTSGSIRVSGATVIDSLYSKSTSAYPGWFGIGSDSSDLATIITFASPPQLTWDADAYVQVPGVLGVRNTIPTSEGPISVTNGQVAYTSINRDGATPSNLTISVDNIEDIDSSDPDLVIIARGTSDGVLIGTGTDRLLPGQSMPLDCPEDVFNTATLTNNQLLPADVFGMSVDSSLHSGFSVEYSIDRAVNEGEDTTFQTSIDSTGDGTGFGSSIFSMAVQSDGKILVGGGFTTFGGTTKNRLIRLNSDGTEDTAFYTNLGTGFSNQIEHVAIQSDGKILVGGQFTTLNGTTRNRLVRLKSDGTEDTAFYTALGSGFDNRVDFVIAQPDGKILVGGDFTTFNSNTRNNLVRLNSDGTEDTAFYTNLGTGFNSRVDYMAIQSDGKILAVGWFTTLNGNTRNNLVRLNSDGTEDTAFYTNLGTGFNSITRSVVVQTDGKILVSGWFTTLNGNTKNRLVRLNSNGTEDTAFYTNLGTGFNSNAEHVAIQSDGKILVGGQFTTLNGTTRNRLVRLKSDGTEDTAFYTALGSGFGGAVNYLLLQSARLLVGGNFTTVNSVNRYRIVAMFSAYEVVRQGSFRGIYRSLSDTWEIGAETFTGDDPGVTFSITSGGQVQYTSTDIAGSTNTIKFKMSKT